MAKKDYATPKHKTRNMRKSSRAWGASAFLIAMVGTLGLIITMMLTLNKLHLIPSAKNTIPHPHHPKATPKKTHANPSPHYDFYTLLPETPTNSPTKEEPKGIPAVKYYFLQVASFATYSEADKLRANLILNGWNVKIEKIDVKNKIWYRVIVGPYPTKTTALKTHTKLKSAYHLNSLIIEKK